MNVREKKRRDAALCQQENQYLTDALAGGTCLYSLKDGAFFASSWSDGLPVLLGFPPAEYHEMMGRDALEMVCAEDRAHVETAFLNAFSTGRPTRFACRLRGRDGELLWIRVNAGPITQEGKTLLFAIFSSATDRSMMQRVSDETIDAVYVIDADDMNLLYVGGEREVWGGQRTIHLGTKCYQTLHGREQPCECCPMARRLPDGAREVRFTNLPERVYRVKSQHIDWNGSPAYIQYISDISAEKRQRKDWARLDRYYQTLVRNMPGGMTVVRRRPDGTYVTEFLSCGFATMTGMPRNQAMALYERDALGGVHPDDRTELYLALEQCIRDGSDSCQMMYRIRKGGGGYVWVRNNCSFLPEEGSTTVYAVFSDITEEVRRQEVLQRQHTNMLRCYREYLQSGAIITTRSDITADRVLEVRGRTGYQVKNRTDRPRSKMIEEFAAAIPDEKERAGFLSRFTNEALIAVHQRDETLTEYDCFALPPQMPSGCYVHVIEETTTIPGTGNLTGILSVWDVTNKHLVLQMQQRLVSDNYDFILGLDFEQNRYWNLCPAGGKFEQPQESGDCKGLLKKLVFDQAIPRDRDKCTRMLDPAYIKARLDKEPSYSFHYSVRSETGVQAKNALVFRMDDRMDWFCFACADITDSLREQQALLRILAQTFEFLAFVSLDTDSCLLYSRQTILMDRPPSVRQGISAVEKELFTDCDIPDDQRQELLQNMTLEQMMARLRQEPEGYSFVVEVRQSGRPHYKQVSVTWGGADRQSVCAVRSDVTRAKLDEARRTEHLRSALALARDANRAKQDFLSAMSHDIRTPMNAIVGMTNLALTHQDDPAQVEKALRIIRDSSNHLGDLIGDILDMSRIESGRLVLNKEPFSHAKLLKMLTERTQMLADQQKIQFHFSISIQHDVCVGDSLRIEQILENLLGNATKFTPAGGSVTLEVKELPPKSENMGWFCYTVSDTGIGMNGSTLTHLYDPFYREQSRQVNGTEGSGLGLSIVKNLVDYKGGVMDVASEPGKGTTFVVKIPLAFVAPDEVEKLARQDRSTDALPENCLQGRRILLVEDHPINRVVAQQMLEDAGTAVVCAQDGQEGLKIFRHSAAGTFDAILMDLRMPIMDGYEATSAIRACTHPQALEIPIIAMTANAFAQDVQDCLRVGMNAHVAKPVDQQALLRVILHCLHEKE